MPIENSEQVFKRDTSIKLTCTRLSVLNKSSLQSGVKCKASTPQVHTFQFPVSNLHSIHVSLEYWGLYSVP